MTVSQHPGPEQLTAYALDNNAVEPQMAEHIKQCTSCNTEVLKILDAVGKLKQSDTLNVFAATSQHLHDDAIVAYVNHTLSAQQHQVAQKHLNDCGQCMRAVLSYRAHIAARKEAIPPISANTHAEKNVVAIDDGRAQRNRVAQKTRNVFSLPLSVAASLIVAVIIYVSFSDKAWKITDEDQASSVPPDVIATAPVTPPIDAGNALSSPGLSTAGIVKVSQHNGHIDWYTGYVETTAVGTVDMANMKNKIQAESVAELTARTIAYGQLTEILHGVNVHRKVALKDLLLANDDLRTASEGFIRGAQVVDKKIEWLDNAPKATVTLKAPLFGNGALDDLIRRSVPAQQLQQDDVPSMHFEDTPAQTQPVHQAVILDARGSAFEPSLYPRIINPSQQSVVDFSAVENNDARFMFTDSLQEAANAFAGKNPITVNAEVSTDDPGAIIVDPDNAQLIAQLLQQPDQGGRRYAIVF